MNTDVEQLLSRLDQDGWEHVEHVVLDEWWADQCWRIRSTKQAWGTELFVTFLIDRQWDGAHLGQRPLIWAIMATDRVPTSLNTDTSVALLVMSQGKFDLKVAEFVAALRTYRNAVAK